MTPPLKNPGYAPAVITVVYLLMKTSYVKCTEATNASNSHGTLKMEQVFGRSVGILLFFQIRQEKPPSPGEMAKDTQVTIVGATMPDELIVDTLQDMLPVRRSFCPSEQ